MKDNQTLLSLLESLMKSEKPIWKKIAYELSKPRRQKIEVNLTKISDYADDNRTILVPGKVLGSGGMAKKVTVAAFSFSESAKSMIVAAGGKALTIDALYKSNPDGKEVFILK
ncbi:50S ribosomal protein L18e [Candidatus Micrarchaeota archaeon]|nr:50S ribosomal protein L18e [Candidatus Micrarchaeota archaeon]